MKVIIEKMSKKELIETFGGETVWRFVNGVWIEVKSSNQ